MKLRLSFVSNSSSSSFIIMGDDNINKVKELLQDTGHDFYELGDKLYTSWVNDCSDYYDELSDLCIQSYDSYMQEYTPSWIKTEGELGCEAVYLPTDEYIQKVATNTSKNTKSENLYLLVKDFINIHNIYSVHDIYDECIVCDLHELLKNICRIVGFKED